MPQRSILVPLDGSPVSEGVLPYAETLARLTSADLRLLYVVEELSDPPWGISDTARERLERAQHEAAEQYLAVHLRELESRGASATGTLLGGDPADCILETGKQADVGMVTMSTHGRGGVQRLLLGSVADKVLRLGTRPTFLVRAGEREEQARPVIFKRILVPLDGSELAEQALPLAEQLARAAGATMVLSRVERYLWQSVAGEAPMYDLGMIEDEITQSIVQYLDGIKGRLQPGTETELSSSRGYPAILLEELALDGDIDLVVMATHGRGGVRRLTIGSMADRMVRLGVPTLLVRPEAATGRADSHE